MRLFIIDWSNEASTPLLDLCKGSAHTIAGHELKDGAEAYRKTAQCKPDAIVVNYAVKPSHGRVTAEQIYKRKVTSEIPIYFIDGAEDDNEKVEHFGLCLSEEELEELLN
jgi:DNA-binding response OmpR family regulator